MLYYKTDDPSIHIPTSLSELLALKGKYPEALPFAGGTYLLWNQASRNLKLPSSLIYLRNVKELTRVSRTETRLEVGSAMPIRQILRKGPKFLSPLLAQTFEDLCPPSVASMATLGGNVSVPDRCMSSFPVLHVLDARCELRSHRRTRWLPVTGLRSVDGKLQTGPEEIITRIQIPMEEWSLFIYRRIGSLPYAIHGSSLILAVVGKTYRRMLTEFRFAVGNFSSRIYRNRDLETLLIGTHLPMEEREIASFLEEVKQDLQNRSFPIAPHQMDRVLAILRQSLSAPYR